MQKIKVLLVDDSAVIRKVLGDMLRADPEIELVGTAVNGLACLKELTRAEPDVITLDIEMPELNGLDTVRAIRARGIQVPIIMCSSLTSEGAAVTLDALASGASDYVTKPSSHGANTRDVIGDELIRKIKGLAANRSAGNRDRSAATDGENTPRYSPKISSASAALSGISCIAIGVSTGGPNALAHLLPLLRTDLMVPVLVAQHMPTLFTKMLAARLNETSNLPVVEASDREELLPGKIYLAPGGLHLEVKRLLGRVLAITSNDPPENSCRPAVDPLFRSVARTFGRHTLGIILTGMGQDGLKGSQQIKDAGGQILVQDRESSAVWGMPGAVYQAGLADGALSIDKLAAEINARSRGEAEIDHGIIAGI
jgi:two-component system chemotaxis response regulator CheB